MVEYRRREDSGGGWPGTNDDIMSALIKLAECHDVGKFIGTVAT